MKIKHTILFLALMLAFGSFSFGQGTTASATYSLGNILADRSFGNPSQSSACPGSLSVNIPAGSIITSVDVVYDFEALPGSYKAFQVSQLRCVSPGGLPESAVAKNTNYTSGVLTYTRSNLTIANGVVGGGNILFELHAGSSFGTVPGCSELYVRVLNNTWTVTVHYLPPAFPDPPSNPNPVNNATGIPMNVGNISWNFGNNSSFYDLYLGTDKLPINKVVDNQVAGATGNYTVGTLPSGTWYYWQVVVRNNAGLELAGPIWNFATECLPKNTPVIANFDDLDAPSYAGGDSTKVFPLCWNMIFENSQWYAAQGVKATPNAFSAPNCWMMSNEGDPNAFNLMILPEMITSLSTLQLSFMAKVNGGNNLLSVGTMSDNNNAATFTALTTVDLTSVYQQFDIPFSAYTGTDKFVAVKFTSPGANTYKYIFIDNVLLSEIPTCPRPENLSATAITQTTATVTWAEQGTATQWNIETVVAGTSPTGNFTAVNTNPFTITGLQPATSYDFYVQSNCGGGNLSYWANKGSFKTACLPYAVPFIEKFDAGLTLPGCWSVAKTATGSAWSISSSQSYSAPNNFQMSIGSFSGIVILISPPLNTPDGRLKEIKLNFFGKRTAADQTIIVGTLSNPLDYNTFTPLKTILPSTTWAEYEVWFNTYTGTDSYIGFKCGNLSNVSTLYLDNINFGFLPYCLNPVDLWVNEIHETDARLHWTESRVATTWQIEVGPVGFVPGTTTYSQAYTHQLVGNDYSFVMTGLEPGKFYDVYMRADCGGADISLWSPKAQFMSQPVLFSPLPLIETFDPGFTWTTNPPTNNVNWTLFTTLFHSAPNSARNQYTGNNKNVLLISKRIDLTGKTNAFLSFWHIAKTDGDKDHCYVEISTDGGANYDQIPVSAYVGLGKYYQPGQNLPEGPCFDEDSYAEWGTGTETPANTWWKNENFDLSAYSNSNNVVIRFRLVTDNTTNKYGWLIDDVSIKTYSGPAIHANPLSFDVEVMPNESTSETLTISNNGDFPVAYTASVQNYSDNISTLVSQDFETGVPADWTIINGTKSSAESWWRWEDITPNNLNGTNFMYVGRAYPDTCAESLISPAFNGTGYSNVYLTFDQCYVKPSSTSVPDDAQVFVWDGTTWQSVLYMKQVNVGTWGNPDKPVFDITQYANPNMKVKFYYTGYSGSKWGVDNFKITASDIPVNWLTLDTKTSVSGILQGGETHNLSLEFTTKPTFPNGTWHSEIQIVSNDTAHSPIIVPVSMTIGCLQPWSYTQTGQVHSISIPLEVAPEIFGQPLAAQDWIGVFFIGENGNEACGGVVQWNGTSGVELNAYGDDPSTPAKDGFAAGESFLWRLKQCGNTDQYAAFATYDAGMPNQGNFADLGLSKLLTLNAAHIQNYALMRGWNGISSYLVPSNPAVENMFSPLADELIILKNLTSFYYPVQGTNTIGNWNNQSGYVVKVADNTDFLIAGTTYAGTTITLAAGWQYLPVLSQCPADVMDIFGSNLNDIIIIQELVGTKVFWPAMQIYSLETFEPGKAYLIKLANQITVSFPECQAKDFGNITPQPNSVNTPWGTLNMTPSSQIALFMPESLTNFIDGDVIGAFDQNGTNFGYCAVSGTDKNLTITLFGDDNTSTVKDGFVNNEAVSFKLMRASTGEVFDVEVEYSQILENVSGNFIEGSFSAISKVKMTATGIIDPAFSTIRIFPNPTSDILNITGVTIKSELNLFNVFGEQVYSTELTQSSVINVGSLAKGTYVLRISNENGNTFNKLVIR